MRRRSILINLGLSLVLVASFVVTYLLLQKRPPVLVMDNEVGLLTDEQVAQLADYHSFLLTDYDIDYRVLIAAGTGAIALYSVDRFEALGVGEESQTGRGMLLLIDAEQDEVRLEISRALEGVFTDAFVTYIQQRQMLPFFQNSRVADGILATTELIYAESQSAVVNAGFDPWQQQPGTSGAGADTRALIGSSNNPMPVDQTDVTAGNSPDSTVTAYLAAMAQRNANPNLDLFTESTQSMLQQWTVTPAQMDNLVSTYRSCQAEPVKFNASGNLAVIRYSPQARACAPWFLERQGGQWRLDLTMLQRAVVFGRSNAWHFDLSVQHPYAYAFEDWRFDANGFPR